VTPASNDSRVSPGAHSHHFGQDRKRAGEGRTILVVFITVVTMVVEIAAGLVFGSMALLADGLHMGSHAVALGIAVFAYVYTRKHAKDDRFNFGTGKVNALGGFTGAVLLALFAVLMAWASFERLIFPVEIAFNQAIVVAVVGLAVNGLSVWILGESGNGHSHHPHHDHSHSEAGSSPDGHHDHNLRSAYLHVLADALTSVLAIFALCGGKYLGWVWLDPFMGIAGAVLVGVWSRGLLKSTARILLDMQVGEEILDRVRNSLEKDGNTIVSDLHIWSIGPDLYAAAINLCASPPKPLPYYHEVIPKGLGLVHVTIEVLDRQ
jgi:cation diffusion facilitator family transporter